MIKTANFHPDSDTKLKCTCNHPLCDERSVKQWVLNKIQLIRNDLNRPMIVNSGGRCPYHPDEKHRTTPADHQNRIVLDVKANDDIERGELVESAIKHGATAIGVYSWGVHIAWRDIPKLVMWVK